jgi:hypothetical protein
MIWQHFKLRNLSTTHSESGQTHSQNENCVWYMVRVLFGVQHTAPSKLVIPT